MGWVDGRAGLSVHRAAWPTVDELGLTEGETSSGLVGLVGQALIFVRRAKSDAKASQKTPVASAVITGPSAQLELVKLAAGDLAAVGKIAELSFAEGDELAVGDIVFAEVPADAGAAGTGSGAAPAPTAGA